MDWTDEFLANGFSILGKATLHLGVDDVLCLAWEPGVFLDGFVVDTAMAKVNEICEGTPRPLLVIMSNVALNHDARTAFSKPSAASRIALLGSTPVDWMTANFRGRRACPYPCPTKFFTERSEAMKWLLLD